MRRRRFAREDAVDRYKFVDLYEGALDIRDETKRLVGCVLLLTTCRLKMRFNEFLHMHEGWYNRSIGVIEIPDFEPCMCKYCWNRAQKNYNKNEKGNKNSNPYNSAKERFVNERYSPKNARQRHVPVAWSSRIMAALEAYFDKVGVYPKRARTAKRVLNNHILMNSDYFKSDDINFHALRATGETFWSFENFPPKARAALGGHRINELGTYSGTSPIKLVNQSREATGKVPLKFDFEDLSKDPRPHPKEPFCDPREIDPLKNYDPYNKKPIFNPRTNEQQADIDMTTDEFVDESETIEVSDSRAFDLSARELRSKVDRFEAVLDGEGTDVDHLAEIYDTTEDDEKGPGQSIMDEWD